MEVLLLGTGSGTGWPNPFCRCASCEAARITPGALRGQSSALLDGTVLLDAGPDVPLAASRHGAALDGVRLVLLTHAHPDHVAPELMLWRHFARRPEPLVVAGPAQALALLSDWIGPDDPVELHPLVAGDIVRCAGYVVRALTANHGDAHVGPGLLYDVTGPDGGRVLYATDTGLLPAQTLDALAGARLDLLLLEETWGDVRDHSPDHLDLTTFAATLAALRANAAVTARTTVVPIHLGHRNPPPAELAARLAAWGVDLLPDGAVITVGAPLERPAPPLPPAERAAARRTLVIGGARSGKSRAAEEMVAACPDVTYVATAPADVDDEWRARVDAHRDRRPAHWTTVESADLVKVLEGAQPGDVLLVDCLTLWLTTAMDGAGCWDAEARSGQAELDARVTDLVDAWRGCRATVVAVSNEVGQGVVPASASGRRFRDEMGRLNAAVAAESDEVWETVAGLRRRLR